MMNKLMKLLYCHMFDAEQAFDERPHESVPAGLRQHGRFDHRRNGGFGLGIARLDFVQEHEYRDDR